VHRRILFCIVFLGFAAPLARRQPIAPTTTVAIVYSDLESNEKVAGSLGRRLSEGGFRCIPIEFRSPQSGKPNVPPNPSDEVTNARKPAEAGAKLSKANQDAIVTIGAPATSLGVKAATRQPIVPLMDFN
jgi:hypothetical protein